MVATMDSLLGTPSATSTEPSTLSPKALQGYLAHKKQRPPRTQQQEHAQGRMVVLRGGGLFLMSELPLQPRTRSPEYPKP